MNNKKAESKGGIKRRNQKAESKDSDNMMSKEKISELLLYLGLIILIGGIFSISYYVGGFFGGNTSDMPVGQEYRLKDIISAGNLTSAGNSTFTVVYYDNDEKHTEKVMIPTNYNQFNFIQSNSSTAILKLEKIENGINYWNIYMPKNES